MPIWPAVHNDPAPPAPPGHVKVLTTSWCSLHGFLLPGIYLSHLLKVSAYILLLHLWPSAKSRVSHYTGSAAICLLAFSINATTLCMQAEAMPYPTCGFLHVLLTTYIHPRLLQALCISTLVLRQKFPPHSVFASYMHILAWLPVSQHDKNHTLQLPRNQLPYNQSGLNLFHIRIETESGLNPDLSGRAGYRDPWNDPLLLIGIDVSQNSL